MGQSCVSSLKDMSLRKLILKINLKKMWEKKFLKNKVESRCSNSTNGKNFFYLLMVFEWKKYKFYKLITYPRKQSIPQKLKV